MAYEALSWADQWGGGGMEDDGTRSQKDTGKNKNLDAKGGFSKVKAIAMISVPKIKSLASICATWIKNQFQRNRASK
ncbi:hypothetical protein VNO77_01748 [Canavalia gladiata]|uniref:Uncharacterized protein n=1 Tax=Canavalia gladiata TaxID=3824 RepID=A0AAN9MY75_CANGL